jgi:hypothetical protein
MKIYLVLAYDQYYPNGDNVKGVFTDEDDAVELAASLSAYKPGCRRYEIVDIVEKDILL